MAEIIKLKNQEDLDKYQNNSYLLWFTADWCGPCRHLKPFIDEILPKLPIDILVVDLTEDIQPNSFEDRLKNQYQIRGLPNIQYVKDSEYFNLTDFFQKFQSLIILKLLS